ncbi:proline-rich protein 15 [Mugil cephalus]|uniref:proline-rich protein 15 n=1 Tax=Mugil cephalus TaxID=48193 RepID=UPI001FB6DE3E|nr:proline-rich protein 15 [Mugil cephalus]XP_047461366.1 proline-rich protein 15 [Mugil cephalus]
MTERTPWWKVFLTKKKTGSVRDVGSPNHFGPDFDPFAQHQEKQKDPKAYGNQSLSQQQSSKSSNLLSDDTFDDSQLESVFDERSCRRNMNVSRSGRFKVKQRGRSSLPIQEKETENTAPPKEDAR